MNIEKKAYGRCEKCGRFMYGFESNKKFIPDNHICKRVHSYEPGVEETLKKLVDTETEIIDNNKEVTKILEEEK